MWWDRPATRLNKMTQAITDILYALIAIAVPNSNVNGANRPIAQSSVNDWIG